MLTDFLSFFTVRKAVLSMMAMRRMSMLSHGAGVKLSPRAQELATNIPQYMKETEAVRTIYTYHSFKS